jgi:hypothetical protein
MSPPKRYMDVLERSPGTGVRLAGRPFRREPMRLSGLKALPQEHPRNRNRGACRGPARTSGRAYGRQPTRLSGLKARLPAANRVSMTWTLARPAPYANNAGMGREETA